MALGAGRLIMLTNVAGILRNQEDPLTRIPACNLAEVQALIADGTIAGGMRTKVQNCIEAIRGGLHAGQM